MISGSRWVPVASTCFALAVGLGLGAGPLQDDGSDDGAARHREATPRAQAQAYPDAFAAAVAPGLYDRRLAGQRVALVTLPGAASSVVKSLTDEIVAAGGAVASRTDVTEGLTAAGQKVLVDTLGTQLAEQVPGIADPATSTYPRIGRLLAAAVATTGTPGPAPAQAATVRKSLVAAKLISDPGAVEVAGLVLIVAGDDLDDAIAAGLVAGLAAGAHGVVVSAPSQAGDLAAVHEDVPAAATVDGSETAAGRVASVLALVRQISGGGGSFGASGIDGPVPVG